MTTTLRIDNIDVTNTYKVLLAEGCYQQLVQWPQMKSVSGNDWQEQNGFEPDLSDPKLDTRDLILKFILKGSVEDIGLFYAFLGDKPVRQYTFVDLDRTVSLRLLSMPSIQYAETFHIMQVQFAADTPMEGYTYQAPSSVLAEKRDYVIDGTPLSAYGVRVLMGTIDSVIKAADVKPLLTRQSSVINGATYDENPLLNDPNDSFDSDDYETVGGSFEGVAANWKRSKETGTVTYKGREITLKCLIHDTTARGFRNYDALLYDLTKINSGVSDPTMAGARSLLVRALDKSFKCYYKSQSVEEFLCRDGKVWIKFSITLMLFKELGDESLFLSSENYLYIISEDGKKIPVKVY